MTTKWPTGLPVLSPGAHLVPEDGACLMEYVSVLAGEPFSDAPRCTDPMLATLARLVNDAISDGGRSRLGFLAPELATAPRADVVHSAALVVSTLLRVRDAVGGSRRLDRHLRRAGRHLRRAIRHGPTGVRGRWIDLVHRHGPGPRRLTAAVDATAELSGAARDDVLFDALASGLATLQDQGSRPGSVGPDGRIRRFLRHDAVGLRGSYATDAARRRGPVESADGAGGGALLDVGSVVPLAHDPFLSMSDDGPSSAARNR